MTMHQLLKKYNSGKIAKSLFSGSENDGWEQFERDPAAADCGQDHTSLRQGGFEQDVASIFLSFALFMEPNNYPSES